jgi:hypothetical protein
MDHILDDNQGENQETEGNRIYDKVLRKFQVHGYFTGHMHLMGINRHPPSNDRKKSQT